MASLFISPMVNGNKLGSATGFVVNHSDKRYLITNWHVVTGRNPQTGAILSRTGGVPEQLRIMHNVAGQLGNWQAKSEELYNSDGSPRWLEHPDFGYKIDAVALELQDLDGVEIYAHELAPSGDEVAAGVSESMCVVGFPFGLTSGGASAIWTRGAIASEPELNFNGLPCFLIDCRTRTGQSGSPVIAYFSGGSVPMKSGNVAITAGPVEELLGVYSGRINEQSDLGFVWKRTAISRIVESGVQGSST